ncbi:MAG: class I SAM-dependent methyltransferase [Anaerolineae bacterium]
MNSAAYQQNFLLQGSALDFERLQQLQSKPAPFTPGEPHFWDDPHISQQMLRTHLDPTTDAASRRPEIIDRSVEWLIATLHLQPEHTIVDLGCGPGLYTQRLAERGLSVTGVDLSQRSLDYAREQSRKEGLDITYRYQNYLLLEDSNLYDVALLIYGDFCPLSPEKRSRLLQNVHRALKPDGYFILDVSTRIHRQRYGRQRAWYAAESGFWKAGPHLVLEQGFDYPEQAIYLDQYIVIEADSRLSVYRNWFQDYTAASITAELESGGFKVNHLYADLWGTPFTDDTEWIGVVAQRGDL